MTYPEEDTHTVGEPIALIGSGCRFPGSSSSPSKLWDILRDPPDLLTKIPTTRFHTEGFYHPDPSHHGTTNVTESYFLQEDHRLFDAGFFNVKQVEAHAIDPQQRILMEVIYESLEAAGQSIESLAGSQTGVYIGLMCDDYSEHLQRDVNLMPTYMGTGIARSIMSNRISYFFDWHGPCMTIDTACSSSLVAVHQAVQLLRSGESDVAVAAGSNLILGPGLYIGESKLKMLSPSSRSRMWDADADGYARGEGVAAVVLKRLSTAIADGDNIECIIRESGVNQDGRTKGITMPSHLAQADLIRRTYLKAGLDPKNPADRCQYFEAHGTGTPAGDPREAEAISTAFFEPGYQSSQTDCPLWVGSIKTVIGHTEGTAGIAGLLKASLAVQQGIIPPNLLFNNLNSAVEPFYTNLEIPTTAIAWPEVGDESPRRASVNSFGFGGTNAHVIVEHFVTTTQHRDKIGTQFTPFVFSAASEPALRATLSCLYDFLGGNPDIDIHDLSYTLYARKTALLVRKTISAPSIDDLHSKLGDLVQNPKISELHAVGIRSKTCPGAPRILACFTGQGAQWATMGRELISKSDHVRNFVADLDEMLQNLPEQERPDWSLMDEFMADAATSRLNSALIAQPLCTVIQIVLFDLLSRAGVKVQAVVGHSSGEIAAAYAAGFLTSHDAVKIAYYRGLSTARAGSDKPGAMMAVGTSMEDALEFCSLPMFDGRLCVAAVNSSSSVTLSGDLDAIEEAKEIFEDETKFARILKVDKAYHSSHMIPSAADYLRAMQKCNIQVGEGTNDCVWLSSTYENTRMASGEELSGTYWRDNMVQPVLFAQALKAAAAEEGPFDVVIELGPHPALKGPIIQTLQVEHQNALPYTGLLSRGTNDITAFADAMGYLWTLFNPCIVDFSKLDAALSGNDNRTFIASLPRYCWDHEKIYWHETRLSKAFRHQTAAPHSLLGTRMGDTMEREIRWRNLLQPNELPWIHGHQLQGQMVYPAAAYLATAVEASAFLAGTDTIALIEVEDFELGKPLVFDADDSGVETIFSLSEISTDHPTIISASFTYYACSNIEADGLTTHATGRVTITLGETSSEWLPTRPPNPPNLVHVNGHQFYSSLASLGYEYSGEFKALSAMRRKKDFGTADILVPPRDPFLKSLLVHPAVLDSALQGMFLAYCWPSDGSLDQLHVPIAVKKLRVNVGLCQQSLVPGFHVSLCSYLTENPHTARNIRGDVDIFVPDEGTALIQIEGIKVVAFSEPTPDTDRNTFAEQTWDVYAPDCDLAVAGDRASPEDFELASTMERVCVFYIKQLNSLFTKGERESLDLEWHHVCLFRYVSHILRGVEEETLPFAKKFWLNDSREDQLAMIAKYADKIEMKLICAVGDNLPAAVRRETTILEHLLANNLLNQFYVEAMGVKELTHFLAKTVTQVVHRYPRMKILEIGAGTGGATKAIIDKIGRAFSSYTFTDISTGFFEAAQEIFSSLEEKMIFKTLDIEKDISEQGYEEHSYDLIVGSMVLHATSNLQNTLENTRRLLKPGGYLIILEITNNDVIRVGFSMSGLPGWWLGQEDGRELSPCVSTTEWHRLLLGSGFSGVDSNTPEIDILPRPMTVIVSQAIDDKFAIIRDATISQKTCMGEDQWDLVLIGGKTMNTIPLIEQMTKLVEPSGAQITCFDSVECINTSKLSSRSAILLLTELDKPIFQDISEKTMGGMKRLFETQRTILWVTRGCRVEEPYMNMSVGFGRTLVLEVPDLRLQFLDLETSEKPVASRLLEILSRLYLSDSWEKQGKFNNVLWSHEEELAYEDGRVVVSRLYFNKPLNDRFNASRRNVVKGMNAQLSPLTMHCDGSKLELVHDGSLASKLSISQGLHTTSEVLVKVSYSILARVASVPDSIYCVLGKNMATDKAVIAFPNSNSSFVFVPQERVIEYSLPAFKEAHLLSFLELHLKTERILFSCGPNSTLIAHEPSTELAAMLLAYASHMSIDVFFTTTRSDAVKRPWITLHATSSIRTIKSSLPSHASTFLDCSVSFPDVRVGAIVASCLPVTCHRMKIAQIETFAHARSLSPTDLTATLTKAVHRALSDVLQSQSSESAVSISLRKLVQMDAPTGKPTIIDWTESVSVPVTMSTVESEIHFKGDRTYVMFGLTSDLAQSTCDWMISHGAQNLVLTSRNPNIDVRWVELLRETGVRVEVIANDITDKVALKKVVDRIRQRFPPIAGIAHGAMVLDDASFFDMPFEKMQKVLRPKVQGAIFLDELFQDDTLDFFIFFSSVASIVGNRGQSAYSASNMFMAALAAQRRRKGLAASILHIGAVLGVGYVTREFADTPFVHIGKAGFMWMSERAFHLCFGEAVLASHPISGCSPEIITGMNTMTVGEGINSPWKKLPRFQHCILEDEGRETKSSERTRTISVHAQLEDVTTKQELLDVITDALFSKLHLALQLPEDTPHNQILNSGADELSIDSLIAVEIRSWFLKELEIDMPVLKIMSDGPIRDLIQFAVEKTPIALTPKLSKASNGVIVLVDDHQGFVDSQSDSTTSLAEDSSESTIDMKTASSSATSTAPESLKLSQSCGDAPVPQFEKVLPMSPGQSRFWFLKQLIDDQTTSNITISISMQGTLQLNKLENAIEMIGNRHEALRTCFFKDENQEPVQAVLSVSLLKLEKISVADEAQISREFGSLKDYIYDIEGGECMRIIHISLTPTTGHLLIGYPHINMDGMSLEVFLSDLELAYNDQSLPRSFYQYSDYTTKIRQALENGELNEEQQFWKSEFTDQPAPLPLLPFSSTTCRMAIERYDHNKESWTITPVLASKIKSMCQTLKANVFHFYLAVFEVLIFKLLGTEDFCIGMADANRLDEKAAKSMGMYLNLLPLRFRLNGKQSFADVLKHSRRKAYRAMANSRLPFDVLLDEIKAPRSTSYSPVFQAFINYRPGIDEKRRFGNATAAMVELEPGRTPYDIILDIIENPGAQTRVTFSLQEQLYSIDDVKRVGEIYFHLLEHFSISPQAILSAPSLFPKEKIDDALKIGQGLLAPSKWPETLVHRIGEVLAKYPDKIALKEISGRVWTYTELGRDVDRIAARLLSLNVAPQSYVAVFQEPSSNFISSFLAILRIGAVYIPFDLTVPTSRLSAMAKISPPSAILVDSLTISKVGELQLPVGTPIVDVSRLPETNGSIVPIMAKASQQAVVLFTSGSTGIPKGVLLSHSGLRNHAEGVASTQDIGQETVLQQSAFSFDLSLYQVATALANGGNLIIIPQALRGDSAAIARIMLQENVTYTIATPSEYLSWFRHGSQDIYQSNSWRYAKAGGEWYPANLVNEFQRIARHFPHDFHFFNIYGPTETSLSSHEIEFTLQDLPDQPLSVGCPLPNYTTSIVGASMETLPIGFAGEICIGGGGVAMDYLGLPDESQKRFLKDPHAIPVMVTQGWTRMYRTGDRGLLRTDGTLEILGRVEGDTQIKLRGFRIELEDIEKTIIQSAQGVITEVIVTPRGSPPATLVAHAVLSSAFSNKSETNFLRELTARLPLPQYMRPAVIIPINAMPLSAHGKTDRRALEHLELANKSEAPTSAGKLTEMENQLAQVWGAVLPEEMRGVYTLDAAADFFHVGGNSMLLIHLQALIKETFGSQLSLLRLFESSTLVAMAATIQNDTQNGEVEIDWEIETEVPADFSKIAPHQGAYVSHNITRNVVLTGSTGFLGRHILTELIASPGVEEIHCIAVRNPDALKEFLSSGKVTIHKGDLSLSRCGLTLAEAASVFESADAIIHNGADVSFLKTYHSLKPSNVTSTKELAQLSISRNTPFHFISTATVGQLNNQEVLELISLADFAPPKGYTDGYAASKWASEIFLEKVHAQVGLPVFIHRPSSVTGEEASDLDILSNVLNLAPIIKAMPDPSLWRGYLDTVSVETVSSDIVKTVLEGWRQDRDNAGSMYVHHAGEMVIPVASIKDFMGADEGGEWELVPMREWTEKAKKHGLSSLVAEYLNSLDNGEERLIGQRLVTRIKSE